ncbi:23S rRNA-intervening sequence protein [Halopseudomonas formosensis]|uniref:23S rRNA-intervening sequence protein n=1 Tax=Halopseudomonas formosensis TaxID=1002526 RepID=A0A1I6AMZ6_9GAMM|nr:four helix bundle protein [Halopseudomonas formosensis]SFQ70019.1 23S rRNA-intervening sequence protein [Halopseudomonas formosensis]
MSTRAEARLDRRYLQLVKLLNIYLNHFPKCERHGLALRIRTTAYEMYDLMIEAQKRYQKKTTLTNLDIKHEQLRMQVRLAHELGYFGQPQRSSEAAQGLNVKRYLTLSALIDEIGRMIGGWIAASKDK